MSQQKTIFLLLMFLLKILFFDHHHVLSIDVSKEIKIINKIKHLSQWKDSGHSNKNFNNDSNVEHLIKDNNKKTNQKNGLNFKKESKFEISTDNNDNNNDDNYWLNKNTTIFTNKNGSKNDNSNIVKQKQPNETTTNNNNIINSNSDIMDQRKNPNRSNHSNDAGAGFTISINNEIDLATATTVIKENYTKLDQNDDKEHQQQEEIANKIERKKSNNHINIANNNNNNSNSSSCSIMKNKFNESANKQNCDSFIIINDNEASSNLIFVSEKSNQQQQQNQILIESNIGGDGGVGLINNIDNGVKLSLQSRNESFISTNNVVVVDLNEHIVGDKTNQPHNSALIKLKDIDTKTKNHSNTNGINIIVDTLLSTMTSIISNNESSAAIASETSLPSGRNMTMVISINDDQLNLFNQNPSTSPSLSNISKPNDDDDNNVNQINTINNNSNDNDGGKNKDKYLMENNTDIDNSNDDGTINKVKNLINEQEKRLARFLLLFLYKYCSNKNKQFTIIPLPSPSSLILSTDLNNQFSFTSHLKPAQYYISLIKNRCNKQQQQQPNIRRKRKSNEDVQDYPQKQQTNGNKFQNSNNNNTAFNDNQNKNNKKKRIDSNLISYSKLNSIVAGVGKYQQRKQNSTNSIEDGENPNDDLNKDNNNNNNVMMFVTNDNNSYINNDNLKTAAVKAKYSINNGKINHMDFFSKEIEEKKEEKQSFIHNNNNGENGDENSVNMFKQDLATTQKMTISNRIVPRKISTTTTNKMMIKLTNQQQQNNLANNSNYNEIKISRKQNFAKEFSTIIPDAVKVAESNKNDYDHHHHQNNIKLIINSTTETSTSTITTYNNNNFTATMKLLPLSAVIIDNDDDDDHNHNNNGTKNSTSKAIQQHQQQKHQGPFNISQNNNYDQVAVQYFENDDDFRNGTFTISGSVVTTTVKWNETFPALDIDDDASVTVTGTPTSFASDTNNHNKNSTNNNNKLTYGNNINDDWPKAMIQSSNNNNYTTSDNDNHNRQNKQQQKKKDENSVTTTTKTTTIANNINDNSSSSSSLETLSTTTTPAISLETNQKASMLVSNNNNNGLHQSRMIDVNNIQNDNNENPEKTNKNIKYRIPVEYKPNDWNDNVNTNNSNNINSNANMTNLHDNLNQSQLLLSITTSKSSPSPCSPMLNSSDFSCRSTKGNISSYRHQSTTLLSSSFSSNVITNNITENSPSNYDDDDAVVVNIGSNQIDGKNNINNSNVNYVNGNDVDDSNIGSSNDDSLSMYCPSQTDQHNIIWPLTDSGILSIQPCPMKTYYGTMFRLCHTSTSNGNTNKNDANAVWLDPDMTECRLTKLRELHYLVNQHSRKHLVDGLFLLIVELKNLIVKQTIYSPMDQKDSFALLNAILHHMTEHKIRFDRFDINQQKTIINFIQSVIIITDRLLERINHNVYRNNEPVIGELLQLITSIRSLMDNVLRAFILACQDGSIRNLNIILQEETFFPSTKNIAIHLRYQNKIEPKKLITLMRTNQTVDFINVCKIIMSPDSYNNDKQSVKTIKDKLVDESNSNLPSIINVNNVNELDVGITEIWLSNIFQQQLQQQQLNNNHLIIHDHQILSVSLIPAVSIQVNFEVAPSFEVMFHFYEQQKDPNHYHDRNKSTTDNKFNVDKLKMDSMWKNNVYNESLLSINGNYDTGFISTNSIQCARLMIAHRKQPVWTVDNGCRTSSFNETHLRCLCKESGLIAAVSRWSNSNNVTNNKIAHSTNNNNNIIKTNDVQNQPTTSKVTTVMAAAVAYRHNTARIIRSSGFHLSPGTMAPSSHHILYDIVLYTSLIASVIFYSLTLIIQYQLRHYETRETFFIIRNLIIALLLIQLTFLLGTTIHMDLFWIRVEQLSNEFPTKTTLSTQIKHILCLSVPIFLHFIHLASMFWMLSHTILLYQRMWRKYKELSSKSLNHDLQKQQSVLQKKHRNRVHEKMVTLNELGAFSYECRKNFLKKLKSQPLLEHNGTQEGFKTSLSSSRQSSVFKMIRMKLFNKRMEQSKVPKRPPHSHLSKINVTNDDDLIFDTTSNKCNCWRKIESKLIIKFIRNIFGSMVHFLRSIFDTWNCAHYLCVSLGFPFLFVFISYLLNPKGYETKRYCWMSIEGGIQYSFIMPVLLLISLNTFLILLVLKRYFKHKALSHRLQIQYQIRPSIRACIILLPFFCLNWFLGVLSLETLRTTPFELIFALTNGVHSFLAFYFHCYQRYNLKHYLLQYGSIRMTFMYNNKISKFLQKYSRQIFEWMSRSQNHEDRIFVDKNNTKSSQLNSLNCEEKESNIFVNQYNHHHHHHNNNDDNHADIIDTDDDDDNDNEEVQDNNEQKRILQSNKHQTIIKNNFERQNIDSATMAMIEKSSNQNNNYNNVNVLSSNLMCCCNDAYCDSGITGGQQCSFQCSSTAAPEPTQTTEGSFFGQHNQLNRSFSFPNLNHQLSTSGFNAVRNSFNLHHPQMTPSDDTSEQVNANLMIHSSVIGTNHHHHHHCCCCQHINDNYNNNDNDSNPQPMQQQQQQQQNQQNFMEQQQNGFYLHHLSSPQSSSSSANYHHHYYNLNLGKNFQAYPNDSGKNSTATIFKESIDSFENVQQQQEKQHQDPKNYLNADGVNKLIHIDNDIKPNNRNGYKNDDHRPEQQLQNHLKSFQMSTHTSTTATTTLTNNSNSAHQATTKTMMPMIMMMDDDFLFKKTNKIPQKIYDKNSNRDAINKNNNNNNNDHLMSPLNDFYYEDRKSKRSSITNGVSKEKNMFNDLNRKSQLTKIDFTLPSSQQLIMDSNDHRRMMLPMDLDMIDVDDDEDLIIIEIEDEDEDDDDDDELDTDEILESDYDHEMVIAEED